MYDICIRVTHQQVEKIARELRIKLPSAEQWLLDNGPKFHPAAVEFIEEFITRELLEKS